MNKMKEVLTLIRLEEYILTNGNTEDYLSSLHELQDKYSYGWYIQDENWEAQIKSICEFKVYILENYKED